MNLRLLLSVLVLAAPLAAKPGKTAPVPGAVKPRVITEPTRHDTDDPAIWIHPTNPAESLILGTDKDTDGALYVWGLDGKIKADKVVRGLVRPNNVIYDVSRRCEDDGGGHGTPRASGVPPARLAPVDRGIPVFQGAGPTA
jgi:hypothetical protein